MNDRALNNMQNRSYNKHNKTYHNIYDEFDTYLYPTVDDTNDNTITQVVSETTMSLNSSCLCKKYLSNYDEPVLMIIPCQHMIHMRCIEFVKDHTCPYCYKTMAGIVTERDIKKHLTKNTMQNNATKRKKYYQMYINIKTVCYVSKYGSINYINLAARIPAMLSLYNQVKSVRNKSDVHRFIYDLMDCANINITVVNKEKLYPGKKVIISNHASMLDSMFISHMFGCGTLMSATLQQSDVVRLLAEAWPVLIIKRGHSDNAVNLISQFVDKHGSIVIMPEGLVTHPNTLIKFRTGSFHSGFPVQPLIIKYEPYFFDKDPSKFMMKLMSQDRIDITITVMDAEFGPFTDNDIENVRHKMALAGNLAISDVSNRDVVDK